MILPISSDNLSENDQHSPDEVTESVVLLVDGEDGGVGHLGVLLLGDPLLAVEEQEGLECRGRVHLAEVETFCMLVRTFEERAEIRKHSGNSLLLSMLCDHQSRFKAVRKVSENPSNSARVATFFKTIAKACIARICCFKNQVYIH